MVGEIIEITQQALQNDKALVEVVAEVAVARKVFLFGQQQYNYVGLPQAGREPTKAGRGSMRLYVSCWPE